MTIRCVRDILFCTLIDDPLHIAHTLALLPKSIRSYVDDPTTRHNPPPKREMVVHRPGPLATRVMRKQGRIVEHFPSALVTCLDTVRYNSKPRNCQIAMLENSLGDEAMRTVSSSQHHKNIAPRRKLYKLLTNSL